MPVEEEQSEKSEFDVLIIGGGPAGLSAAIWCADLGLDAILFEGSPQFGGQLGWTFNRITNYPGIGSVRSDELRAALVEQARGSSTRMLPAHVVSVDVATPSAVLDDGRVFRARSIIIATGIRRRRLGIPGEDELLDQGVLRSGVGSLHEVAGRRVVIVGGGDAAVENAVILSESASEVTLVLRSETFRARSEFIEAAKSKRNVDFRFCSRIAAIRGSRRFEAVEILHTDSGKAELLRADFLLIRIGTQPCTELFIGQVEMDRDGFILVAADTSTSTKSIYAIGDVAFPVAPTLSTAAGTAAIAAKAIRKLLA